jgi:hypothetical protein
MEAMSESKFGHVLVLAVGIALAGWFVGVGFEKRSGDRYVTVKGVAEREVDADLALWPITLNVASDDLGRAQEQISGYVEKVNTFLEANGIDLTQVSLQTLRVTDAMANPYRQGEPASRFIIQQTLMVRSEEPERIFAASQKVSRLVNAGVAFSSGEQYGPGGPTFLFTRLNDVKPEMIAEATAEARKAAEQFARDSGSALGPIRRANQGVFQILPRDPAPGQQETNQLHKTVRVVTTIEYLLQD